ncbi:hypothetical protein, partial [Ruthenibacterium intestinale]|uniref:hypothetical protein n=1 Tax=Ruthenibacterium intestinale TaxID=3133163 RepID=UPI0032C14B5B
MSHLQNLSRKMVYSALPSSAEINDLGVEYKKTPSPLGVGSHFSIFYFGNFILPFWKIRFALF